MACIQLISCHNERVPGSAKYDVQLGRSVGAPAVENAFARRASTYSQSTWHAELAVRFVEWLRPSSNLTFLDVGTGTGFAAFALASLLEPGARIHGVDISAPMIQEARRLAITQRNPHCVTFSIGDAHQLGIRDRSVDAVIYVTSLQYMMPTRALSEGIRALRFPGTVAIAVLKRDAIAPAAIFRKLMSKYCIKIEDNSYATGSESRLRALLQTFSPKSYELAETEVCLNQPDIDNSWSINSMTHARHLTALTEHELGSIRQQFLAEVDTCLAANEQEFRSVGVILAAPSSN